MAVDTVRNALSVNTPRPAPVRAAQPVLNAVARPGGRAADIAAMQRVFSVQADSYDANTPRGSYVDIMA